MREGLMRTYDGCSGGSIKLAAANSTDALLTSSTCRLMCFSASPLPCRRVDGYQLKMSLGFGGSDSSLEDGRARALVHRTIVIGARIHAQCHAW